VPSDLVCSTSIRSDITAATTSNTATPLPRARRREAQATTDSGEATTATHDTTTAELHP
jgi:hypothetical protein